MQMVLLRHLGELFARLRHEEDGQGLAEYALILLFIAVVAVAALTFLGTTISSLLSSVGNSL
jgi:Flp pilus assembly pilin Flp